MADDVRFPMLETLKQHLDDLDGREVTVTEKHAGAKHRDFTDDDIDRIHEGLLRKQRGGSLGLND